jgi:hypothetical protein
MAGQIKGFFRDARWLTQERAHVWLALLAAGNVIGFIIAICRAHGWLWPETPHFSTEFMGFYAAGRLVNAGTPDLNYATGMAVRDYISSVHIAPAHVAMQRAIAGDPNLIVFAFFYPPVSWLAFAPLARLPFYPAFFLWVTLTSAIALLALRGILGRWRDLWPALAYLSVFENAGVGENAFLIAGLLGFGFLQLDRRPVLAGLLFGALCFKPPLLLPSGLLLLFGRRWAALLAMGASAALLCITSILLFGYQSWVDYVLITVPHAEYMLRHHGFSYSIQVTVFSAMQMLGSGLPVADIAQACASLSGILALFAAARWSTSNMQAAILAASLPVILSVMLDYDLTICGLAIAFLVREARCIGPQPWDKAALAGLFFLPLAAGVFRETLDVPLDPLVAICVLLALLGHIRAAARL